MPPRSFLLRPATVAIGLCAALLAACSGAGGLPQDPTTTTNGSGAAGYTLSFAGEASASPAAPATGEAVTISFAVADQSSENLAASDVPWTASIDGSAAATGTIGSIPANGSATASFTVTEANGSHQVQLDIDPQDVTGAAGATADVQDLTLVVGSGGGATGPATTAFSLALTGTPSYDAQDAFADQPITVTFTASDTSATGAAASAVPWRATIDGVADAVTGTISIPANGSAAGSFTIQEPAGDHTVEIELDPQDTTGGAGQADDVQELTIAVAPVAFG
jgi:hypothetical protein